MKVNNGKSTQWVHNIGFLLEGPHRKFHIEGSTQDRTQRKVLKEMSTQEGPHRKVHIRRSKQEDQLSQQGPHRMILTGGSHQKGPNRRVHTVVFTQKNPHRRRIHT